MLTDAQRNVLSYIRKKNIRRKSKAVMAAAAFLSMGCRKSPTPTPTPSPRKFKKSSSS